MFACVGHDHCKHIARVAGATSDRNHHRPVLVDDANHQLAWNVGSGEHSGNAGRSLGRAGVDGQHIGAGVVGEV